MDIKQAQEIISALALGVEPETGELLSDESCFNQPKIIRALYTANQVLEKALKDQQRRASLPVNAGKPWSQQEDDKLAAQFDAGCSIADLTKKHERTRGSITARLERLGKINQA